MNRILGLQNSGGRRILGAQNFVDTGAVGDIVNDRDILLQSTFPRSGASTNILLMLVPSENAFQIASNGAVSPASITFTPIMLGVTGTVAYGASSGASLTFPGGVPTLNYNNMLVDSCVITGSVTVDGVTYSSVPVTIRKQHDAAEAAEITPERILTLLEDRVTNSQLNADLRSTIKLITDPVSVPGSVQALIKAETDGRVAAIGAEVQTRQQAISKEVDDRIAAVLAEAGARTTYIQNYTFSQQAINSALSIQATQIAAAATAYTDQKTGTILSTAAADVRNYSYSKADTTSAISASETRLRAEFNAAGGVTTADIQNWSYSKAATDSAEAAQTATLTTGYQGYADQKKSEAMTASSTDVRNYAYGKSTVDAAEAAQSATLTTNYTAYADAARAAAVSTSSADVRQYTYSKSTVDNSIAAAIQQLRSEFVGSGGATEAYVTNYAYSKSQIDQSEALQSSTITTAYRAWAGELQNQTLSASAADVRQYAYSKSDADGAISSLSTQLTASYTAYTNTVADQTRNASYADVRSYTFSRADINGAIAQSTSSLSTTVGQNTTTIQQQATSIDGLNGQLTWKIDSNGHVSGFGLASTPINGVPYSTMIFNVDVLGVALPGDVGKTIFVVGQVNGQPSAVFRSDLTVDGGITARMLKIGGSDNIIPDPKFYDLGWWGRTGFPVGDYTGQDNGWLGGAILLLTAGGGATRSSTSKPFTSTPGATMRLEVQVQLSTDFVGEFSVYFYVEGASLYSMGCPNLGTWPSGDYPGWPIQFNSGSAKGRYNFSQEITIPVNSQCVNAHMVVVDRVIAGNVAFGSCSATRVADQTLIGPGSVFTKHLDIATGGDIHSGQTGFDLGNGFWLEGEGRGHGARFSIGNSAGKKIICDPQNGILGLFNADIVNPGLAQKTITGLFSVQGMNGVANGTKQSLGSQTASMSNASGAVHYVWSAQERNGTITLVPNGATCAIYAQAPTNGRCQGTVSCTGTDASGFSASDGLSIDVGFGNGVPT